MKHTTVLMLLMAASLSYSTSIDYQIQTVKPTPFCTRVNSLVTWIGCAEQADVLVTCPSPPPPPTLFLPNNDSNTVSMDIFELERSKSIRLKAKLNNCKARV